MRVGLKAFSHIGERVCVCVPERALTENYACNPAFLDSEKRNVGPTE